MMEKVKQRIAQLEHETDVERQREEESEERAALRMTLNDQVFTFVVMMSLLFIAVPLSIIQGEPLSSDADEKSSEVDESYLAAKEILSEAGDLKGVHSTKSVAAM